ncbi:ROK family transcriptional regulator [Microbacterium sp. ASV49]|uniref:ROK family transcriptional regulator n=1 Tax=Microbacterium candidum TaxID=3041922 RepID=A0ABT7MXU6_9MICO|nr:ROK family transcriptional regulator [Microbacterium sp. ASV49]MDL9979279.1 ROK family transcriptional regulator [Microbacterium sp. ASV49]
MTEKTVPGTPAWLRTRNDRTALGLFFEHGELTRNRLVALTGLSKPTASQMVQRLESLDLISETGAVSGRPGPSAATYAVRADAALGVAVDIDANAMRATVVDLTSTDRPTVELPLARTARDRSPVGDVRRAIVEATDAAGVDSSHISAVCVAVQGAVDPRGDDLRFADTLPGWPRTHVRTALEDALGIAVTIDNDVNLAALAERSAGAGAGLDSFALLWLGEGLGLAMDLGGTVHRGFAGSAGEIGYVPVPRTALDLDPDATDLQSLIGGIRVARLVREAGGRARTYRAAIDALRSDQALCDEVMRAYAPRVAVALLPALAMLDPERIVLGGATGALGGPALAQAVASVIRRHTRWSPDVAATGIATTPVLRGAGERLVADLRASVFDRLDRI